MYDLFVHFADNTKHNPADPDRDRHYKLRQIINMVKKCYIEVYLPGKNLTVDKNLVLFKGRLSFQQYIKTKGARFGINLFQLCTSNEIPLDFIVYHGNMALVD